MDHPDHPPPEPAVRLEPDQPESPSRAAGGPPPERGTIAVAVGEVVPIRRRQPPELVEQLGGPADLLILTLALSGDDLEPDEVSRRLGCEPSSAYRKGEAAPGRAWPPAGPDASRAYATGAWLLELRGEPPVIADDLVETLLRRFPAEPSFWQPLHRDFRVQLRLGIHTTQGRVGCSLSSASLSRCAVTGAPLFVELHVHDGTVC